MYGRSKLTIHESIEEGRELGGPGDRELQFEDEEDEPVGGGGMGGFQSQGNRSLLLLRLHRFLNCSLCTENKYVVKHKSAKLFMTYTVGKLEAALNISHLILSASSQRVS